MAFAYHQQPARVSAQEQLKCSACKVTVLPTERNIHYRSDWHRYNVKRKCVDMPPISQSIFEQKLKSIIASGQKVDSISSKKKKKAINKSIQKNYDTLMHNEQWQQYQLASSIAKKSMDGSSSLLNYKCTICSKTFKTYQQCKSHLNTKKHKLEFTKYHKNLRNQQQEEINAYQATNAENAERINPSMDNLVPLNKLKPLLTVENNPFITIKPVKLNHKKQRGVHNYNDDESKFENIEGHQQNGDDNDVVMEHDDDNHTIEQDKRDAINPSLQCLFCTETSFDNTQDLCLQHMCDEHGFFIPIPKRLEDVDALLNTAGQIIGEYHQCVWCWRIFKSLRGCQAHMRHTGHCKLQIEYSSNITYSNEDNINKAVVNENDESPFAKYFDFDKVIIDSDIDQDTDNEEGIKGREVMVRERRHITDINDCDELVRNDGTVIGHRGHMLLYKQRHQNLSKYRETQSEEQIIAQINNPQRKLKLEQMEKDKNSVAFEKSGAKQQHKGGKIKENEAMHLQTRQQKVSYQHWVNLQKSKQLY